MTDRPDLVLPIDALIRWLREQESDEALFIVKAGDSIRVASTHGTTGSIALLASAALEVVCGATVEDQSTTL